MQATFLCWGTVGVDRAADGKERGVLGVTTETPISLLSVFFLAFPKTVEVRHPNTFRLSLSGGPPGRAGEHPKRLRPVAKMTFSVSFFVESNRISAGMTV